ncbi:MAG: FG-GAP repeat domain-containing protein [Verrucomicrobiia bacterium]|jgi:hypothetical protein
MNPATRKPFYLALLISISISALANAVDSDDTTWKKHVLQPASETRGMINTAVASDFDKDGHIDVLASFNGGVVLLPGPDWKTKIAVHQFPLRRLKQKPSGGCIHSCLLDVDGDGDQDFIGSNNTVFWLECPDQPREQKWIYRTIDDEIKGTHCLITGDVDGDGVLDLIANSGRNEKATKFPHSLTWLQAPKTVKSAAAWKRHVFADKTAPGGSHYAGFGDVNGDGRPDIAYGAKGGENFPNGQWFAWWENPKDGKLPWKKHVLSDKQPGASNIIPADLNGDGHIDYFATRGHDKGALWFKGPDFRPIVIDAEINGPHSLELVDLDRDGDIDAVTCGRHADSIAAWYENDGSANFKRHVIGRDQGSYDTRTVDLDNDGDLDILIAGHVSNNLVWFENPDSTPTHATREPSN